MDAAWKYEQNKKKIIKIGQKLTEKDQIKYSISVKNW